SAPGLKKRTRRALGLGKKDKDTDKKTNGAPNGFYGEIDWDRYSHFALDKCSPASKEKHFSSSDSEDDEDSKKKFKIRIKPLVADSARCVPPSMDELKASVGGLALSPSLVRTLSRALKRAPPLQPVLSRLSPEGARCLLLPLLVHPHDPSCPPGNPSQTWYAQKALTSSVFAQSHSLSSSLHLLGICSQSRPFSPPVSGSPPPFAPLARAESSSSLSSFTSHSAASTPTLGRDLRCSRGPSPLTMGPQDTLPVAAAFTETINAYFKGADPSRCAVKITGEMVLSFPAGITRHFACHPTQPVLTFIISNYSRLEQVLPNPQLLCCDTTTDGVDTKEFWVNMPNLMSHLKKVAEQKPQATYYNVDMIKYQVSAEGIQSTPLNLAVSWRGDSTNTDLRIDYKYNAEAMAAPVPLHNIHFVVPVDGGLARLQTMIPPATWNPEQQTIQWKIQSLSQRSDNGGVGALLGRFQMEEGPCKPPQLAVQFTSEGSTLSGCDIQLVGTGYRLSLVKKRFAAGKYLADN
uniref:SH3GL interacting endocytic adaptor 1b n=1 Tax=Fundulus heteroclitus TaxID=8078 RepID=A0A3Q2PJK4_FUNHE